MTVFVEGTVTKVENWNDEQGADVFLHQDDDVYYYEGSMNIPNGPSRFEIMDGEGKNSNKKLIVSVKPLKMNVAHGNPPPMLAQGEQPQKSVHMIQMKEEDFQRMMRQKVVAEEVPFRTLDAAARIYASLNVLERDPLAACRTVIRMAEELSGYLA